MADWEKDGVWYHINQVPGVWGHGARFNIQEQKPGEEVGGPGIVDEAQLKLWLADHPEAPPIL